MPRAASGPVTSRRHKRLLAHAKGNRGARGKLYRRARETVERGWKFAYRDRKTRQRNFRQLWIVRINAACQRPSPSGWGSITRLLCIIWRRAHIIHKCILDVLP